MQIAFEMLKKACLVAPVLAFADFDNLFLLETNTSKSGLGVVLSQKQPDWQYHPVAYVSWSLTKHECNYHSTKQEFLALKWAITEQSLAGFTFSIEYQKGDNSDADAPSHVTLKLNAETVKSILDSG